MNKVEILKKLDPGMDDQTARILSNALFVKN